MIIGITGYKRSGKDTVANVLVKNLHYKKLQFSTAIKQAACAMFGWTMDFIEEHKDEVDPYYGISPRQVLTSLGTEYSQYYLTKNFHDYVGRNIWVKRLFRDLDISQDIVISDVRFPHEVGAIFERKGIIIKVVSDRGLQDTIHESEMHISYLPYNYLIHNDLGFKELEASVMELPFAQI